MKQATEQEIQNRVMGILMWVSRSFTKPRLPALVTPGSYAYLKVTGWEWTAYYRQNVISMEYEKWKNSGGFHFQPASASTMFLVSSLTVKNTFKVNKTTVLVSSYRKINEIELFSDSYIT